MSARKKDGDRFAWVNYIGLGILLICYAGAIWNVIKVKRQDAGENVIRIVHWQLELGVRDGLQTIIDEFEAYKAAQGKEVEIIQIPIPERAYTQYVTTQLIGGTAPDMIQIGKFPLEYLGRYFHPLSKDVQSPNPFLARRLEELKEVENPTDDQTERIELLDYLADQPWMDSFTDGLRAQFEKKFQEYYGVGFSTFTVRMFYNKDIFERVLGHSRPPETYREALEFCRRIQEYAEEHNPDLVPIAGSKYQVEWLRQRFLASMTADLNREYDLDRSGQAEGEEKLMAMLRGEFTPYNPQYRGALQAMQNLSEFFPKGFMALGREDAGFDFVQGDAAMITSGSWDALSFLKKISNQPKESQFEVGVFDMPAVSSDDPEFGQYADGRSSEANAGTGFAFGITRYTRNKPLCIEFLQYCTTPRSNAKLNKIAGWIPVVHGAEPADLLKPFMPNYVGYFGRVDFEIMKDGKALLLEEQEYWPLISQEVDYEKYAEDLWEDLPTAAATDFKRLYDGFTESIPNRQARRSAYLAGVVLEGEESGTRAEREKRLLRSLEPLLRQQLGQLRFDRLLELTKEAAEDAGSADSEFNQTFHRALKRELNR